MRNVRCRLPRQRTTTFSGAELAPRAASLAPGNHHKAATPPTNRFYGPFIKSRKRLPGVNRIRGGFGWRRKRHDKPSAARLPPTSSSLPGCERRQGAGKARRRVFTWHGPCHVFAVIHRPKLPGTAVLSGANFFVRPGDRPWSLGELSKKTLTVYGSVRRWGRLCPSGFGQKAGISTVGRGSGVSVNERPK